MLWAVCHSSSCSSALPPCPTDLLLCVLCCSHAFTALFYPSFAPAVPLRSLVGPTIFLKANSRYPAPSYAQVPPAACRKQPAASNQQPHRSHR